MRNLLIAFIVFFVLTSCVNVADTIDSDWKPELFFKSAQQAMDNNRYQDALYYYEVFLIRYPEDQQKRIAAEYEQAFIYSKTGKLKLAEAKFNILLDKYESSPYAMLYPPRFKKLAEIGLKNINKKRRVNYKLFWRLSEKDWAKEQGQELLDKTDTNTQ